MLHVQSLNIVMRIADTAFARKYMMEERVIWKKRKKMRLESILQTTKLNGLTIPKCLTITRTSQIIIAENLCVVYEWCVFLLFAEKNIIES